MSFPFLDRSTAPPYQQVLDYTGSPDGNQPVYVGWADPGVAINDPKWMIRKFSYDGSNRITNIQYANGDVGFRAAWNTTAGTLVGSVFSNAGVVFK